MQRAQLKAQKIKGVWIRVNPRRCSELEALFQAPRDHFCATKIHDRCVISTSSMISTDSVYQQLRECAPGQNAKQHVLFCVKCDDKH